ncbi:helix-turn-helix transcriptional regulator [Variovorax sp. J22P168]|uniref:helix-turn-helix domain-containing protein n=1 Tax=Variovorax jilinensis TaxID=3053513 RepID=UPI002576ED20|nr:helix-turn-helix transcriptional regulator [Variovorax sp. J22P168]MDM0011970.1 helix-turn-helix transcriptional regulator [Variovorax sp. J22P168]
MEIAEHWRLRLIELKNDLGLTQASLALKLDKSPDYVSRLLYEPHKKGRKNLGLQTIRTATESFELPPGWFDMPTGSQLPSGRRPGTPSNDERKVSSMTKWPFRRVTPANYARLTRAQQDHIEDTIQMILPPASESPAAKRGRA